MNNATTSPQVIVSLTSFPAAIPYAVEAIRSVLNGSVLPDKVVLYLDTQKFPDGTLPTELEDLKAESPMFEVRFDEAEIRSYKKLIPALRDFPNDIIVTIDDDIAYHSNMLRDLVRLNKQFPNAIIAHRVRKAILNAPYRKWRKYKCYDFIFKMVEMELLEDKTADACDVYNAISKCLFSNLYTYCLAHEYTDSYISPINPVDFDYFNYRKLLKEDIELRVANKLKWLPKDAQNNRRKIEEAHKSAWEDLYYKIYKRKKILVDAALPYIYAYDYENALINYNIAENSIIFSHERHGDQRNNKFRENNIEHKINDDISVKISTNFCFGSSSYFHVTVIYKGIALLPYSVWVRYYYARYSELLGCTRSYQRNRENWLNCMNFLEKFINDKRLANKIFYKNANNFFANL